MAAAPVRRAFSVSVFARHEGRLLLIKHMRLGLWLPVGGEIEPGETPLEAAARELREETRLEGRFTDLGAVDGTPAGLLGYEEHLAGSKGVHLNFAFAADVESELVVANDEFAEFRWTDDVSRVDCPPNVKQLALLALHRTADPLVAIAKEWIAAFNAHDLDRLLALYGDDAVHVSPKLRDRQPETKGKEGSATGGGTPTERGMIRGKAALRAWWADSFQRLPQLKYEERAVTASSGRVFLEYDRLVPGEPTLRVAELFVVRDRAIRESRVFHG
jgi:ADP-ribose pyrophosphatase YjhB (NUDIX family)